MAEKDVFDEIKEIIDENGSVPQSTKDRLLLMAVKSIHESVQCVTELEKRVEKLEQKSVVMMMEKHPKATVTVIVGLIVFLSLYDFRKPILLLLGYPTDVLP